MAGSPTPSRPAAWSSPRPRVVVVVAAVVVGRGRRAVRRRTTTAARRSAPTRDEPVRQHRPGAARATVPPGRPALPRAAEDLRRGCGGVPEPDPGHHRRSPTGVLGAPAPPGRRHRTDVRPVGVHDLPRRRDRGADPIDVAGPGPGRQGGRRRTVRPRRSPRRARLTSAGPLDRRVADGGNAGHAVGTPGRHVRPTVRRYRLRRRSVARRRTRSAARSADVDDLARGSRRPCSASVCSRRSPTPTWTRGGSPETATTTGISGRVPQGSVRMEGDAADRSIPDRVGPVDRHGTSPPGIPRPVQRPAHRVRGDAGPMPELGDSRSTTCSSTPRRSPSLAPRDLQRGRRSAGRAGVHRGGCAACHTPTQHTGARAPIAANANRTDPPLHRPAPPRHGSGSRRRRRRARGVGGGVANRPAVGHRPA